MVHVYGNLPLVEVHTCGKSPRLKEIVDSPCSVASSAATGHMGSVLIN